MDAIFTLVKALGNNNPAGLVKLLQDDLLDNTGQREAYVRSLFNQGSSIEYDQFHKAMKQFALKYGTTLEDITEKLMQRAPPVLREFNTKGKNMESIFAKLQKDGKNTVDELIKWLKNSKLVEDNEQGAIKVRGFFDKPTEEELIEFEQFKAGLRKLAEENKNSLGEITKILIEESPKLLQAIRAGYADFKDALKPAKLIESTKQGEEKARALFSDVVDKKNVELSKFKQVVERLASEQQKTLEDLSKQLASEGPKLMQSAMAGVAALKEKFLK